jgi:hypothetical protein
MGFDVSGVAGFRPGSTAGAATTRPSVSRSARWYGWFGVVGIGSSLTVTLVVSLGRASWMAPPLRMPADGPPFEITSLHLTLASATYALWLSAIIGGLGLAAALIAVRRGARPSVWALLIVAGAVVAVLTVLPPVGSTDSLDYMAFGRMVVLGHSPYVMVPWDLRHIHDVVGTSIPWEWGRTPSSYGPAATVEQYLAARLGGTSPARIVFWLKVGNALAFGAVAYVADRLLRSDPGARLRAHLLWTINPLLIWQLIAAAHLDVLAAAAGLLGLVLAAGWPTMPAPGQQRLGRVLAGSMLVGLAADIKITFVLFGLGLAWAFRRSVVACVVAACGMLLVLLPSYGWFGPPAFEAVVDRGNRTTADNFYQLLAGRGQGFLMTHVYVIAAVVGVGVAIVVLARLPIRGTVQPAIFVALGLSTAWLFTWQYQLPSYEAMIICLLILAPASWLDWLVIARLTAATLALMPGGSTAPPTRLLARISLDNLTVIVPVVLLGAAVALVVLCLTDRTGRRQEAVIARPVPSPSRLLAADRRRSAADRVHPAGRRIPSARHGHPNREDRGHDKQREPCQQVQVAGDQLPAVPVVLGVRRPVPKPVELAGGRARGPEDEAFEDISHGGLTPYRPRPGREQPDDEHRAGKPRVSQRSTGTQPVAGQQDDDGHDPDPVVVPAERRHEQASDRAGEDSRHRLASPVQQCRACQADDQRDRHHREPDRPACGDAACQPGDEGRQRLV